LFYNYQTFQKARNIFLNYEAKYMRYLTQSTKWSTRETFYEQATYARELAAKAIDRARRLNTGIVDIKYFLEPCSPSGETAFVGISKSPKEDLEVLLGNARELITSTDIIKAMECAFQFGLKEVMEHFWNLASMAGKVSLPITGAYPVCTEVGNLSANTPLSNAIWMHQRNAFCPGEGTYSFELDFSEISCYKNPPYWKKKG
jgi:hypothetical protein